MEKVRIGIIGLGVMGSHHARVINKGDIVGAELTAVSDMNSSRFDEFQGVRGFTDPAEMLSSGLVDAVIISTPHFTHTSLGIAALQNKIHTLVEKPISVHKADAEKLIAAHDDPSVVFAAMFNVRTSPMFQKLKELISAGELGRISRINWIVTDWFRTRSYYESGSWRATWKGEGGGVLLNQCPHQLDLWQWLFGMPDRVQAVVGLGRYHDIEVEDDVTAIFEYNDGPTGVFVTTTGETPGTNRLEIAGERGKIVVDKGAASIAWTRNEVSTTEWIETSPTNSKAPFWNIEIPVEPGIGSHAAIIQNFTDAILTQAPLIAPAEEGLHSVELGNAMLYSGLKRKAVDMPLNGADFENLLNDLIAKSPHTQRLVEMGF